MPLPNPRHFAAQTIKHASVEKGRLLLLFQLMESGIGCHLMPYTISSNPSRHKYLFDRHSSGRWLILFQARRNVVLNVIHWILNIFFGRLSLKGRQVVLFQASWRVVKDAIEILKLNPLSLMLQNLFNHYLSPVCIIHNPISEQCS